MKEISGSYNKVASSYRPLWNLGVAKNYVAMVTDYNSLILPICLNLLKIIQVWFVSTEFCGR